ncbi:hypothetical protein EV667_1254 [Ancylobacter aquaticus]|uniref:Glycosyl transferase n=1 Tax=Ancylobacter aquaticus TaxID=100 RepID=A0A4R1ICZ2_ANCAQ|nr:hypothetical protein [Ancylobacter aquaticus]TCK31149.1 hypothetical protein EV667_1254 [Ancylobacter aquaticus]
MVLHVNCFKWGDLYAADDVNRLRAMFLRNLTIPHVFHCVTDTAEGLRPDILVHPLPSYDFCDWDLGNARKLALFSDNFLGLNGELLVQSDIDMVVIGNVDFLADRPEENFLIARGRNQSGNTRGHSAILRHRVGTMTHLWEDLVKDPAAAAATCQHHRGLPGQISDQRWLDRKLAEMTFLEDGRVAYFRQDCNAYADHDNPQGEALPPEKARIISFAGKMKPQHVMDGSYQNCRHAPFVAAHWHE